MIKQKEDVIRSKEEEIIEAKNDIQLKLAKLSDLLAKKKEELKALETEKVD